MDEGLDRGLLQVTDVRRRLTRLLAEHHELRVYQAEAINDDFPLHRLHRIDDDSNGTWVESLKALLCVDVNPRHPAAEARVRVVPAHHHLRSARLLQHLQHLCLEHRVDSLNRHAGARLWHGENIDTVDRIVVDELSQHQSHHLHRYSRAAMFQHLK
eukprot:CAMPEP_0118920032 /NCGR_PEP_ID=MMETSP1166-20130328/18864_1 /TAXON_ID=1104430 /ORGANISM="Chrysoreinhardia sp, Strain CCMP3193" /LENGTH=156 /DNA_ID=CAMNT_0006860569 /DNA_START=967 /DNA_END=1437 /DNA_ORIENTATION=+